MFSLVLALALQTATPPPVSTLEPKRQTADVVLANAHSFTLTDTRTGVVYRIYIALPQGYGTGNDRYATLYLLDADNAFALATQAYRLLRVDPGLGGHFKTGNLWTVKPGNSLRPAETGEVLLRCRLRAQVGVDLGAPAARPALEDVGVM
jgi:hypothetical protein